MALPTALVNARAREDMVRARALGGRREFEILSTLVLGHYADCNGFICCICLLQALSEAAMASSIELHIDLHESRYTQLCEASRGQLSFPDHGSQLMGWSQEQALGARR